MVKRAGGWGIFILVLSFLCTTSAQDRQVSDPGLIYYQVLVNTVKIYYLSPYTTIYGTTGEDVITGSGVILDNNEILTCYHTLDQFPLGKIRVVQFTGDRIDKREGIQVEIAAFSRGSDLLLLKIDPPFTGVAQNIKIAPGNPALGEEIAFTGHTSCPFTRLRLYRYLEGALGIMLTPVFAGDSGGGVFNYEGQLIGIIRIHLMLDKQPTLYGYAIPLKIIQEFLRDRPRQN